MSQFSSPTITAPLSRFLVRVAVFVPEDQSSVPATHMVGEPSPTNYSLTSTCPNGTHSTNEYIKVVKHLKDHQKS